LRRRARESEMDRFEVSGVSALRMVDGQQRIVMGEVLVPDVTDAHGDVVSAATIEKAAHAFLERGGAVGLMHRQFGGVGTVVESFVAREGDPHFAPGAWVLAVRCSEETWAKVRAGELNGFSIGGFARRRNVDRGGASDG